MARKDTKTTSTTASKRKESPSKEELPESKRPKTVEEQFEGKNPGNVIGGLKGTLKNPNASEEAKEHAMEMLDAAGVEVNERVNKQGKDLSQLMSGYKSTYERSDASESERKRARDIHGHLDQYHTRGGHLGHVIGGYKATLSNPNVSDEAKENAKQMLEELGAYDDYEYQTKPDTEHLNMEGKDINHVIAGYKGTLNNPNVSDEAKENAQRMLDELDGHQKSGRHLGHVMAGYKATLSNASTSDEAKERARRTLKEMGADDYDSSYTRDERLNKHGKDLSYVIGGYKGAANRDDLDEDYKEHARRSAYDLNKLHGKGQNLGHVIGGYKATLSNEKTSDEAKDHARRMLEELGAEEYDYAHYQYKNPDFRGKNFGNVMGGYKATLHNPNSSEEAKEHARKILAENDMDEEPKAQGSDAPADFSGKNVNNVLGGYKATLHNPNSSEEAKEKAREVLSENGVDEDSKARSGKDESEKDPTRVKAGIKAAINNPNVSEETKDDLRNRLDTRKVAH